MKFRSLLVAMATIVSACTQTPATDNKIGTLTEGKLCRTDGANVICDVAPTSAPVETDPKVGTLSEGKWCMSNGLSIECTTAAPVVTEADPKVGTLTDGKWCTSVNGKVDCSAVAPVLTEADPKIGTLTAGKTCVSDGQKVVCDATEADPKVGTLTDGKWCTSANGKVDCNSDLPAPSSTPTFENVTVTAANGGLKTQTFGGTLIGLNATYVSPVLANAAGWRSSLLEVTLVAHDYMSNHAQRFFRGQYAIIRHWDSAPTATLIHTDFDVVNGGQGVVYDLTVELDPVSSDVKLKLVQGFTHNSNFQIVANWLSTPQ